MIIADSSFSENQFQLNSTCSIQETFNKPKLKPLTPGLTMEDNTGHDGISFVILTHNNGTSTRKLC